MVDAVAVVSRFFGGTRLGAGGLIRAYGQAVAEGVALVGIVERRPLDVLTVRVPYDAAGRIERELRGSPYPPVAIDYGSEVTFTLHLAAEAGPPFRAWLADHTAGAIAAVNAGRTFEEIPVALGSKR